MMIIKKSLEPDNSTRPPNKLVGQLSNLTTLDYLFSLRNTKYRLKLKKLY